MAGTLRAMCRRSSSSSKRRFSCSLSEGRVRRGAIAPRASLADHAAEHQLARGPRRNRLLNRPAKMRDVGGLRRAARTVSKRDSHFAKPAPRASAIDGDEGGVVAGISVSHRRGKGIGDDEAVRRALTGVTIVEHEHQPVAGNDGLWFFEPNARPSSAVPCHALDEYIVIERDLVRSQRLRWRERR